IIDNPDDETRRLVYADWLEEHGDPRRAELIRLWCRLTALGVPLHDRLAEILGADAFNRLVTSVPVTREEGRLRFWQEQLLATIADVSAIVIVTQDEFLRVFADAKCRDIPREPITREVFLSRIAANPYDLSLPTGETPDEWMAAAWQIDRVREEL